MKSQIDGYYVVTSGTRVPFDSFAAAQRAIHSMLKIQEANGWQIEKTLEGKYRSQPPDGGKALMFWIEDEAGIVISAE